MEPSPEDSASLNLRKPAHAVRLHAGDYARAADACGKAIRHPPRLPRQRWGRPEEKGAESKDNRPSRARAYMPGCQC